MARVLRNRRANLTPAKVRLLQERNRTWTMCRVLAAGIGRALRRCYDVDDLLIILRLVPGLDNAARMAKDAEDRFMRPPKRRPKAKAK
jgi:hypothetical protein